MLVFSMPLYLGMVFFWNIKWTWRLKESINFAYTHGIVFKVAHNLFSDVRFQMVYVFKESARCTKCTLLSLVFLESCVTKIEWQIKWPVASGTHQALLTLKVL